MSSRPWFRLDDVLPLAEHAMACPSHRLTGAQTLAQATLRPALVRTGTPAADALTSNGVPVWYGERATVHTAQPFTWRHIATGRHGTAARPGYDSAYLPLDGTPAGQPPVIDMLRQARHTGRRWASTSTAPTGT